MGQFRSLAGALCLSLASAVPIASVPSSAWQKLNTSVDGNLYHEYPMGAFCYLDYNGALNPHVNLVQCAAMEVGQSDTEYVQPFAQGYPYATWETCMSKSQSCNTQGQIPVDPISPLVGNCQQGNVPDYYINAQSDSDIQAGLAFAAKHDIPLVIKASGHDYKGRSAGQGALALWLYNYKPVLEIQKDFVPAGASSSVGDVVTFSAGHDFEDVLSFANDNGGTIIAATSKSVHPAGGFVQAGGHSPLSPVYGLAVDNTYEMKGILANGTSVTASRQQNSDLFYALRGGGGGTFAVVTEVSMRLIPTPAQGYQFAEFVLVGVTETTAEALLKILIANAEQWSKDGWGGYAFPSIITNHTSAVFLVNPKLSLSQAQASMKPLTDFVESLPNLNVHANIISTYPSYYDIWNYMLASGDQFVQGMSIALSSRLVPLTNFQGKTNQQKLFKAIYPISQAFGSTSKEPLFMCLTAPYFYDAGADANTTSITPAWRKSLWHVIAADEFDPEMSKAGLTQQFKTAHDIIQPLVDLTPGSGAYQNEGDVYETNPAQAFWGEENYNQLLILKKKYDPGNVLTCWDCIGWDATDPRYSCYLPSSSI